MKLRLLALSTALFITHPMPAATLRQVLCHRSGLQREATVGGYFDGSQPTLAATVASISAGMVATRPGEKTRFSNFAASIAGHVVERVTRQSFEDYQRAHILDPLGMKDSAWTLAKAKRDRIIVSHMQVADGRGGRTRRDSPLFDLGTIPAGNLFSTVDDTTRFASALIANDGKLAVIVLATHPRRCRQSGALTSAATGRTSSRSSSANATGISTR